MQAALKISNLTVKYGKQIALENVSFEIQPGEYVGLIGPNGAGKSTLLQTIMGLIKPEQGEIATYPKQQIGYIQQHMSINNSLTLAVKEVVGMGIPKRSRLKDDQFRIAQALQQVGLSNEFMRRTFSSLSGGQKQRTIIARSLIHEPKLLLFDEPLAGIDYQTKIKIYDLLADLNQKLEIAILFVSHEVEHITSRCERVLCLNKHLHEGCHPLSFATEDRLPYQTEDKAQLTPIKHEHLHEDGQTC